MNPTPTTAETPTPRTDAAQHDNFNVDAPFARTLERELATAQAELTTLREKLAEEQAGAASMREALAGLKESLFPGDRVIPLLKDRQKYDAALSTTTGKATLEELERLRAEVERLKRFSVELSNVAWWCANHNANLQHGELHKEGTMFSVVLLNRPDGLSPVVFHGETPTEALEKAKASPAGQYNAPEISPQDGGVLWQLAVALHAKFYPEAKEWEPGADATTLISQIDNMTAGLARQKTCEDCGGCGYVTFGDGEHMNGHLPCPSCNLSEIADTLKSQRVSALATIAELRARVSRLEGALREIERYGYDTTRQEQTGVCPYGCDTPHIAEQALQPTAPTEPEKASKGACPACRQPWAEHDFGAPQPFCPPAEPEKADKILNAIAEELNIPVEKVLAVAKQCDEILATRDRPEKAGSAEPQPATVPLALAEGLAEALEAAGKLIIPRAEAYDRESPMARPAVASEFDHARRLIEENLAAYRANHPKP